MAEILVFCMTALVLCACAISSGRGSHIVFLCCSQQNVDRMRALFSLLLFLSWAFCLRAQLSPEWDLFQDFIERYNKSYRNDSNLSKTRFLAFKVEIVCLVCVCLRLVCCLCSYVLTGESPTPPVAEQLRG